MISSTRTTTEVARLLGVPPHRIIYLVENGAVDPQDNPSGRGHVRRFSRDDVLVAAMALELHRWGIPAVYMQDLQDICQKAFKALSEGTGGDFVGLLKPMRRNLDENSLPRLILHGEGRAEVHMKGKVLPVEVPAGWGEEKEDRSTYSSASSETRPPPSRPSHIVLDLMSFTRVIP